MVSKKYIIAAASVVFAALAAFALPIRSVVGSANERLTSDYDNSLPTYALDSIHYWWDGKLSSKEESLDEYLGGSWIDVVEGAILSGYVTKDVFISGANFGNAYSLIRRSIGTIESDFSIHAVLELPSRLHYGEWCICGIGRDSGFENGIVLSGRQATPTVAYRKKYSTTVLNSVDLGVSYGSIIAYTLVFHYVTKTYVVFVNGEYVGESTIEEDNWNLDGQKCALGLFFISRNENNDNTKIYELMFYDKALTEKEVAQNFEVDKDRWGLWD